MNQMEKAQLREKLQERLLEMSERQKTAKSKKACQNLISTPQFQNASTIMLYLSLPYEADTTEAILCAWQLGKIVTVPKISWQQRQMIPVQINSLETGFSTEITGLRNPLKGTPTAIEKIDLVVAPALGFDRKGNRLGHGGSYYDRFFANMALKAQKCGFAFAEQVIEEVPTRNHDRRMDFLVTDEEIIHCNPAPL
jgi:5-formyltetrahydrofolate cyclo-ligase